MADGKTHARDSLFLSIPTGVAVFAIGGPVPAALAAFGCYSGIVLSPDLDQQSWTYSEWVLRKIPVFGWVISWLFFIYWYPYSIAFKHGNWLTHVPIISTMLRLAYALFLPMLLFALMDLDLLLKVFPTIQEWLMYFFCGLCVSDATHWAKDGFRLWR